MDIIEMTQRDEPRETFLERAERDLTACEVERLTFHWKQARVDEMVAELRAAVNAARNGGSETPLCQAYLEIHLRMQDWWFEGEFKRIFRETLKTFARNRLIRREPVPIAAPVVTQPPVVALPAPIAAPVIPPAPITPPPSTEPTVTLDTEGVNGTEEVVELGKILARKDALLDRTTSHLKQTRLQLRQEKAKTSRLEKENADLCAQLAEQKHAEPRVHNAPRFKSPKPTFPEQGYHRERLRGGSSRDESTESSCSSSYTRS